VLGVNVFITEAHFTEVMQGSICIYINIATSEECSTLQIARKATHHSRPVAQTLRHPTDTVHFQRTKDPTKRNKISYLILNFEFAIVPSDFFGNERVKEFTPQSFGILVPAESKTLKCPDSFVQSRSEFLVGIAR